MLRKKVEEQTYLRWQNYGTAYGVSRYSLVALTGEDGFASSVLAAHMRTLYARMMELVIVQRASVLVFSEEIKNVTIDEKVQKKGISALYREYIKFINQIYFRDVTAQDQGVELYDLMQKSLSIDNHIKDLDNEMEELHSLADIGYNQKMNSQMLKLTKVALIFSVFSILIAGFSIAYNNVLGTFFCDCTPLVKLGVILFVVGGGAILFLWKYVSTNK